MRHFSLESVETFTEELAAVGTHQLPGQNFCPLGHPYQFIIQSEFKFKFRSDTKQKRVQGNDVMLKISHFFFLKRSSDNDYKAAAPSLAIIRSGIRGQKRRTDHWRDAGTPRRMRRYMS